MPKYSNVEDKNIVQAYICAKCLMVHTSHDRDFQVHVKNRFVGGIGLLKLTPTDYPADKPKIKRGVSKRKKSLTKKPHQYKF